MAINPFKAPIQTRSRSIPSQQMDMPFIVTDGKTIVAESAVDATKALRNNADVYAVVSRIASDMASCEIDSDSEPFKTFLNQPSKLVNGFNFWQSVIVEMLITGNSYVVITKDSRGTLKNLEHVPSDDVEGTLEDYSASITYTVNFNDERGTKKFPASQVLHFSLLNTGHTQDDNITGISPLMALSTELKIIDASNNLTLSTLKNGLTSRIVLSVPEGTLEASAKEAIRTEFQKMATGENAGKAIILDQGLNMDVKSSINPDVTSFLTNADFGRDKVAEAFGVPTSVLNGTGDAQSSIDMLNSTYLSALHRYIVPITSELSYKLKIPIKLDTNGLVDGTGQGVIDNVTKLATGNVPIISPEQAQAILTKQGILD